MNSWGVSFPSAPDSLRWVKGPEWGKGALKVLYTARVSDRSTDTAELAVRLFSKDLTANSGRGGMLREGWRPLLHGEGP